MIMLLTPRQDAAAHSITGHASFRISTLVNTPVPNAAMPL